MSDNNSSKNTMSLTDITIVGAGPIGLSMCQALRNSGLRVDLVEIKPQAEIANPQYDGREIAFTHRTKAFSQELQQWQQLKKIHYLKKAAVYNGHSNYALRFEKPDSVHGKPIETLGYLVSNNYIRQSAYDVLADEIASPRYLTTHFDTKISHVDSQADFADVKLENGHTIRSKLVLAADSRTSFMRKLLGIGADLHEFGRTVLLVKCKHTGSNQLTAHESFFYGTTLAILPLGEFESSMVITIENSKKHEVTELSDTKLAILLGIWLNGQLGDITVTGEIHEYPLLAVHAKKFYGKRSALIGDAAVGMHPVTAHGYNLGMESVAIMTKLIHDALQNGPDIGNENLLNQYHRTHSTKTRTLYHGTNAIVRLYTAEHAPARIARTMALKIGNNLPPLKKLITSQLTG